MIDPKELRIGNWLRHKAVWSYRNDGGPAFNFQVESMDFYAFLTKSRSFYKQNGALPLGCTRRTEPSLSASWR